MNCARLVSLAVGQADQSPLPVDVRPLNCGDLAASSASEQGQTQSGCAMRADLPCPLRLLDCIGSLGDFGLGQEALDLALAIAFNSPGRIGSRWSQAKINGVIEQHMRRA